jgi:hypothetical protein
MISASKYVANARFRVREYTEK